MTPRCKRLGTHGGALLTLLALGTAACAAPEGRSGNAGETASAGTSKPTAPIAIDHDWLAPPAVGSDLSLSISVAGNEPLGDVTIELDGGEALVVDAGSAVTRAGSIEAGIPYTFEPAVYAAVPGTHYLAVTVTATIAGQRQSRSVAIPVRLGGDTSAAKPEAGASSEGTERVRSLPAEENVRRR